MYFHYQRSYRGPIQAVILDWAGTTVDYGSLAPVAVFVRLFAEQEVTISAAEARGPMGLESASTFANCVRRRPSRLVGANAMAGNQTRSMWTDCTKPSCRCNWPPSAIMRS